MMYDFVFEYRRNGLSGTSNRGFFLSLIDETLKAHGLNAKVRQEPCGEWIRLHVLPYISKSHMLESHASESSLDSEATKKQILSFAQSLSHTLPLSLEFEFITLVELGTEEETCENLEAIIPPFTPSTHYYTPEQTSLVLNPQSEHFAKLNLPKNFHTPLECPSLAYFADTLSRLKNNESICFDTSRGMCELSLTPPTEQGTQHQSPDLGYLVMCDIASLKSYFRAHQAQIAALASFEKPLTYLVPKEVFASQFARNHYGLVLVGLPFDMPLALLCALGLGEGIEYIYLRHVASQPRLDSEISDFAPIHHFAHTPLPMPKILTIPQPHAAPSQSPKAALLRARSLLDYAKATTLTQGCEILQSILQSPQNPAPNQNPSQNLAQNPSQNLPHNSLRKGLLISLDFHTPSAFYMLEAERVRELLEIRFECNPALICEMIAQHYESGGELMESFLRLCPQLYERICAFPKTPMPSNNLLDIFDTLSFILGLDSQSQSTPTLQGMGQYLIAHAYGYVRQRGPRIDYKLVRDEGGLRLDVARIVRSSLSFKCADMENEILCFGIVDSLCEFVANLMRDTFINHGVRDVLLQGDWLTHGFMLDKMLDYCPKEVELHLPQRL